MNRKHEVKVPFPPEATFKNVWSFIHQILAPSIDQSPVPYFLSSVNKRLFIYCWEPSHSMASRIDLWLDPEHGWLLTAKECTNDPDMNRELETNFGLMASILDTTIKSERFYTDENPAGYESA